VLPHERTHAGPKEGRLRLLRATQTQLEPNDRKVDATSVQPHARKPLSTLAHEQNVPAIAIVLNLPEDLCVARSQARPGRPVPPEVVRSQVRDLAGSLPGLLNEGFRFIYLLSTPEEIDGARFTM